MIFTSFGLHNGSVVTQRCVLANKLNSFPCLLWLLWAAWVMSRTLTEENCLLSERGTVSISVHVNSLHHWKRKVQICVLCCDKCFYLSHQSPSFLLSFPFHAAKVKGRRTGRSRYLCTTKSAATGWETTSISTCTSAPRRVETGGSTLHTKSPLTVRNPPFLFPCFP